MALTVALAACSIGVVPRTVAAPGAVGSTTSSSPNPRSSITLNRPPAAEPDDLMVASVVLTDDTGGVTAPAGWSLVRDDAIPGAIRQAVYVKVAGVAEPAAYTWALPSARRVAGGITAYSDVDTTHPVDGDAAALQAQAGTAITAPRLTTSEPDTRVVLLTAAAAEGNLRPPAGLEKRWHAAAADADTTSDAVASAADTTQMLAGPAPPLVTTASEPGPAVSVLVALRPARTVLPPDADPPDTAIDAGPPATVTSTTAMFVFSADEPASFRCALDGAMPKPCSSPATYTRLAAGPHVFTVVATDSAGNVDPLPSIRQWTVEPAASADPVFVGAGDIAHCGSPGDEATAALVEAIPGTVFTAGDNAYTNGTTQEFTKCYDSSWGRFKPRTMPAPGNHEYQRDRNATGYYKYFGDVAGDPEQGWYDYTLGSWHVVVLNTACSRIGGCGAGSPQELWLRHALAASKARCTVAVTHHARFSSAKAHGSVPALEPLWQALYDHGADLVVSGHDHVYERFGPQKPDGAADAVFGLRQIVVGTGGRDHRTFGSATAHSEVRNDDTFGVLKLTLHPDSYDWEFVPEAGKTFTDEGTTACHDAPPPATPPVPSPPAPAPGPPTTAPPVPSPPVSTPPPSRPPVSTPPASRPSPVSTPPASRPSPVSSPPASRPSPVSTPPATRQPTTATSSPSTTRPTS
ncbi:MAG TPA: metallophosphoesterase [Acidimicrobiia bacterium]|nr:metallophosphoesterase [Acidimicrobiia bacterium]